MPLELNAEGQTAAVSTAAEATGPDDSIVSTVGPDAGERARARDPIDLGDYPSDPLVIDLVTRNETSIRLRNAVITAAGNGQLPIRRLSDYLAVGDSAPGVMMRAVSKLGLRSAMELDGLMAAARAAQPAGTGVATVDQLRTALVMMFEDVTTEEALASRNPPARLLPALAKLGFADKPLSAFLLDYPKASASFFRLPNTGRTTVSACRSLLTNFLEDGLVARRLPEPQVKDAVTLLLDRTTISARARRDLGKHLAIVDVGDSDDPPEAVPSNKDLEPIGPPQDLWPSVLAELAPRAQDIIQRRFGLGRPSETLEDLGQTYGVTRERIRQIEAKTLRLLSQRVKHQMSRSVLAHGGELWTSLVGENLYLTTNDLGRVRRNAPGAYRLALEICNVSLEEWLSDYACPFQDGWVGPDLAALPLSEIHARLNEAISSAVLPRALGTLIPGMDDDVLAAIAVLTGRVLFAGYVLTERPGRRIRRALRLHALLAAETGLVSINPLHGGYRAMFKDDLCSVRDALIVMEAQPQLFLEVLEGIWTALGGGGTIHPVSEVSGAECHDDGFMIDDEEELEFELELEGAEERQTICQAIEVELQRAGPTRISDLVDRAPDYLPPGRSANSVGPVLLTSKDRFVRLLPGIYALRTQLPSPSQILAHPPAYMFAPDLARTYALARRGGEPWGAFPLWSAETDYLWCVWARQHAEPQLLESLLAIARVEEWTDVEDRDAWSKLVVERGRFSDALLQEPDSLALPALERVFAACRYLQAHGQMSWISANRILFRRVTDHRGAGLLACLIALGALSPDSSDWQASHRTGPRLAELTSELERAHLNGGQLDWSSPYGTALRERTAQRPHVGTGWLSDDEANTLLNSEFTPMLDDMIPRDPLEQLLAEQSRVRGAENRQALLRDVVVAGPVRDV